MVMRNDSTEGTLQSDLDTTFGAVFGILADFLAKTLLAPINQGQTSVLAVSKRYNYNGCPNITMEL